MRLAVRGERVLGARLPATTALAGGLFDQISLAGEGTKGVVNGARIELRPFVGLPRQQLAANKISVRRLENPHRAEHQQPRRRHTKNPIPPPPTSTASAASRRS